MNEDTIAILSVIAGIVTLVSGLLAVLGYTGFRLVAGIGLFTLGGVRDRRMRFGLVLSAIGGLLTIVSLLR